MLWPSGSLADAADKTDRYGVTDNETDGYSFMVCGIYQCMGIYDVRYR